MRLDKYLCSNNDLSRTEAKRLIGKGFIKVNDSVVKSPSVHIKPDDVVFIDDEPVTTVGTRYIMLNKPLDTVCTARHDDSRSVLNLLDVVKVDSLHIAGRLDIDTTGLVLITDDGQWSHQITSPKKDCGKTYLVSLADPISDNAIAELEKGILLHDEKHPTKPATVEKIDGLKIRLTIFEGKYHQVKRMLAAVNNKVIELHRESIGNIHLDSELEPGEWRYLRESEIFDL